MNFKNNFIVFFLMTSYFSIFILFRNRIKESLTFGVLVALFHNFALEMILVAEDVSFPLGHRLLLTDPNLVSDLYTDDAVSFTSDKIRWMVNDYCCCLPSPAIPLDNSIFYIIIQTSLNYINIKKKKNHKST